MVRLLPLLVMASNCAWADWSPKPSMFTYDAVFVDCLSAPDTQAPAVGCNQKLSATYTVKRALAWAFHLCHPGELSTCRILFEDEGVPFTAVELALSLGCINTDPAALEGAGTIPRYHCINVAADIILDEGVVPRFNEISCGINWIECGELAHISMMFWANQVMNTGIIDNAFVVNLQSRSRDECAQQGRDSGGWADHLIAMDCEANRSAELWMWTR